MTFIGWIILLALVMVVMYNLVDFKTDVMEKLNEMSEQMKDKK